MIEMSRAERGGKQLQEEMFSVALRFAFTKGTIENTYFINKSIPLHLTRGKASFLRQLHCK